MGKRRTRGEKKKSEATYSASALRILECERNRTTPLGRASQLSSRESEVHGDGGKRHREPEEAEDTELSKPTKEKRQKVENLIEPEREGGREEWDLIWISDQAWKPDAEPVKERLARDFRCRVKAFKTHDKLIRQMGTKAKSSAKLRVALVSHPNAIPLASYFDQKGWILEIVSYPERDRRGRENCIAGSHPRVHPEADFEAAMRTLQRLIAIDAGP